MKSMSRLTAVWTAVLITASVAASERRVAMDDLPGPVQEAVREYTKGLKVIGFEEETEDGKTLYEVEVRVDGKTRDILFDATGKVVEDEMEVALDSIPEAARSALEQAAGGGEINKVEAVTKDGITVYEAKIKKDGKKSEVVVGADGMIQKQ
jgi:uncharacterized membrane protein YkoI